MTTRAFWRSPLALAGIACSVVVIVLDAVLRHLSGPASGLTLFVGRFHPLAVHLPIGVILLVAAAEAASFVPRFRARVDAGIGLTLPVLLAGAVSAFLLGHLLARSGGFPPRTLVLHRRLELFAVVGVGLSTVAWAYQAARGTGRARGVYRGVFGVTLAVLSGGAHFGGTMTRGDRYLSKYAPGFLLPLLGGVEPKAAPATPASAIAKAEPLVLSDVVLPILRERCVECHGPEKSKGELRLDSLAGLLRGGENGAVVVPGAPDRSPLLARMLLPLEDDDRMPPEGKPGPTPAEREVIRFWIERGATDSLKVRDALAPLDARGVLERALGQPAASGIPARSAPVTSPAAPEASVAAPEASVAAPEASTATRPDAVAPDTATASTTPAPPAREHEDAEAPRSSGGSAESVLAGKCAGCHGKEKQKAKLRVDSLDALLAGGKHGAALVPGRPSESLLVKRVELPLDAEGHMPPKEKPQLTAAERSLLRSFAQGLSTSGAAAVARAPRTGSEQPVTTELAGAALPDGTPPPVADGASGPSPAEPRAATAAHAASGTEPGEPADPALVARLPSRLDLFGAGVLPLLRERCEKCHGGKFPAGALSVADRRSLARGGSSGPAVVPGDLARSTLWQRVSLPLADSDHMPPEEEAQLGADDLALLRAFVLEGAPEGATVRTSELSAGAVRALAERAPATSPPPAAALRTAGCGACTVGETSGNGALWRPGLLFLVVALARRRRSRAAHA